MKHFRRFSLQTRPLLLISLCLLLILGPSIYLMTRFARPARADSFLKFDEGGGTTTKDSQNTASGTITNAQWKSEEYCVSGKCLFFDGSGDFVDFGDNNNYDFAAATNFTISLWFRHAPRSGSGNPEVLVAKSNASAGYKIQMENDGDLTFAVDDDATWTPDDAATSTAATYDDNQWHFLTAVKTGTTKIELYIDGVLVGSDSSLAATGTLANSANLYIGVDGDGSSNGYTGFIDEVNIYTTTARSIAQIKTDMVKGAGESGTNVAFGAPAASSLSSGLAGYWKYDESSWTANCSTQVVLDSSGNSNNGADCGNAALTSTSKFGNAATFDGSGDYVGLTNQQTLSPENGDITLSSWVRPAAVDGAEHTLYSDYGTATNNLVSFTIATNNKFRIYVRDGSGNAATVDSTTTPSTSTWYYVTAVKSGQAVTMYINGVQENTSTNTSLGTVSTNSGASPVWGALNTGGGQTNFYNGILDESRIYNRALSISDITQLYNFAPGPVLYFKLDENTGTSNTYDTSTYSRIGTFGGSIPATAWTQGKIGSALRLDGIDDRISVPDANTLDINSGGITLEAWVKISNLASDIEDRIISKDQNDNLSDGNYGLNVLTTNNLRFSFWDNAGLNKTYDTSTNNLTTGVWHHVVASHTWGSGASTKIYIDGNIQTGSWTNGTGNETPITTNNSLCIGSQDCDTTPQRFFDGLIDEVKIYNYARTPSQIAQDMNGSSSVLNTALTPPIAWWKFNEGNGDVANNSGIGGSSLNGDLAGSCPGGATCPTWTSTGKFDKALSFDGSNDYINIGNPAALQLTGNMTISGWVYMNAFDSVNGDPLISKWDGGTENSYLLIISAAQKPQFSVYDTTNRMAIGNTTLQTGAWYFLTGTREDNNLKIYLNGKLDGTASAVSATKNSTYNVEIGRAAANNVLIPNGTLDDIRIYNYALTEDQVKTLYNYGISQSMGSAGTDSSGNPTNAASRIYCPPGNADEKCGGSNNPSPKLHLKLDENTGTSTVSDTSGNGYTGSLNGTVSAANWVPGKLGRAYDFNGTDNYIDMGDIADGSAAMSWGAWINADSFGNRSAIFKRIGTSEYAQFALGSDNSGNMYCLQSSDGANWQTVMSVAVPSTGVWHHFMCVNDTVAARMYLDGKLVSEDLAPANSLAASTQPLKIGLGRANSVDAYFDGRIDDVRIYDYARGPNQVAWDYNQGRPVAWWKMNEASWNGTAGEVKDSSGNGYHGVRGGGATTTAGKINNAGTFNGTSDYVSLPTSAIFNGAYQASVSMWIKPNAGYTSDYRGLYYVSNASASNNFAFQLAITSGEISFYIPSTACVTTGFAPTAGQWTHVAITYDTYFLRGMKIYKDGKLVKSCAKTGTLTDSGIPKNIGRYEGNSQYFPGLIDDVKVFNYELTAAQIKNEMNQGSLHFGQ